MHELTFKQEFDRLEYLKVIKKVNRSHVGAPTFLIPKEDITVCLYLTSEIKRTVLSYFGIRNVGAPQWKQ